MRIPRWAGLLVLAVLAFWLGRGSSDLSAQAILPDGVFVRDSGGTVWLIIGGQRAQVPFLPADDGAIASVPDSGHVGGPGRGRHADARRDAGLRLPAADHVSADADAYRGRRADGDADPGEPGAPMVSIQVDDERIVAGQEVSITVIAQDTSPIEWIQWEGTIEEDDDNDNQATGDPELDDEHRHNCDGQTQCAFVWHVTPTKSGRYVLRARGEDEAGNRSEWVKIDFRVQDGPATPTPQPAAKPSGSPTP